MVAQSRLAFAHRSGSSAQEWTRFSHPNSHNGIIMPPPRNPRKASFFKAHILPALFIFVIPGFSIWFFAYAESSTDSEVLAQVHEKIRAAPNVTESQKEERFAYFDKTPISEIMASDDPKL